VTGSAGEKALAEELEIPGRVFPAAGLYSVRENAALYSLLDVFITNDTGPMHIAAAAGARTVCVFGPGDHRRFSPSVSAADKRVVRKDIPGCNIPCYKFNCPAPECLKIITPAEVLAAAGELLR